MENQESEGIIKEILIEESMSNTDPKLDQSPIISGQKKVTKNIENENFEDFHGPDA